MHQTETSNEHCDHRPCSCADRSVHTCSNSDFIEIKWSLITIYHHIHHDQRSPVWSSRHCKCVRVCRIPIAGYSDRLGQEPSCRVRQSPCYRDSVSCVGRRGKFFCQKLIYIWIDHSS